jgi:serine/threonine protein kinase
VGGDLMSLLRQDVRLPESSVHDFGRDLVVALQYLHHKQIIYCDLKLSNVLLDENGRLKRWGFGLSRRLSDINKTPLQSLPPVRAVPSSSSQLPLLPPTLASALCVSFVGASRAHACSGMSSFWFAHSKFGLLMRAVMMLDSSSVSDSHQCMQCEL